MITTIVLLMYAILKKDAPTLLLTAPMEISALLILATLLVDAFLFLNYATQLIIITTTITTMEEMQHVEYLSVKMEYAKSEPFHVWETTYRLY